ncbi:hypothetical protein OROMI_003868 [Orobanche minor]
MDKSWMHADRRSQEFDLGVDEFLMFALESGCDVNKVSCPYLKCAHGQSWKAMTVKDHLIEFGIDETYKEWIWHGEGDSSRINIPNRESEIVEQDSNREGEMPYDIGESNDEELADNPEEFLRVVEDGDQPLYPDMLLLMHLLLPEGNQVPSSAYRAKKTLVTLGMEYEKIHACPNDCILYRYDNVDAIRCSTCGVFRWKLGDDGEERFDVPAKVLWYVPPIPRFRKMFQLVSTAKSLIRHDNERVKDDKMRHPADSPTWKMVDDQWPSFGADPRNLRLALSSDGFNPRSTLSSKYSCWPVILVIYNLPPWLCFKRKYMMLTLLISGPKQPGNDIDLFLQPLIDDLKKLWSGVERVLDSYKIEYFSLRAVLFWTINDFPAYGNLSGSIMKCYNGCPVCLEHTKPHRLVNGNKLSYQRHRRFLPRYHPYQKQADAFDTTVEVDTAPIPLSGEEVLQRVEGLKVKFGKPLPKIAAKGGLKGKNGKSGLKGKKKVVAAALAVKKSTLSKGKTKDGVPARLDMAAMKIRTSLLPLETDGKNAKLPLASWNLNLAEKEIVCSSLHGMKLADRFCANVQSLVSMDTLQVSGMKSHDCHTMLHHLLPIAIRSVLDKPVRCAIIRFCHFFKAISSKVIDVYKLKKMQADLIVTVCDLEKFFPPSFDILIHLFVHLVREVELCGPIFFRWMYPFERYMKTLKGYVKNPNYPEGCIAERYIAEEAMEFLDEHLQNEDTVGVPVVDMTCRPLFGAFMISPTPRQLQLAHLCLLQNTDEARPYFEEHMVVLKHHFPDFEDDEKWLIEKQNTTFAEWLKHKVEAELVNDEHGVSEHIRWLVDGPVLEVPSFDGYQIDGVNFSTKDRDNDRQVQCSGVSLLAVNHDTTFYGVIKEIWELDYHSYRLPDMGAGVMPSSATIDKLASKKYPEGRKTKKGKAAGSEPEVRINLKKLPKDYPGPLRCLWIWVTENLQDGKTLELKVTAPVFGIERSQRPYKSDMYAMCTMGLVAGGILIMYMCYLHEVLKKAKMLDMVAFVDPYQIATQGCWDGEKRARTLSARFATAKKGQLFIMPYNTGKYWILTVVKPEEELVYFFDPVRRRLPAFGD